MGGEQKNNWAKTVQRTSMQESKLRIQLVRILQAGRSIIDINYTQCAFAAINCEQSAVHQTAFINDSWQC